MSKRNDFIFIDSEEIRYHTYYFLVVAGGKFRIPVWLAVTTYGLIALLLIVAGAVVAGVTEGESWGLLAWGAGGLVAFPLAVLFLIAIGSALVSFVQEWVKVFKGARAR